MKRYDTVVLDFKPEPQSLALLQRLETAGLANPILFGGALRDDYFRNRLNVAVPTNDYDIKAGINPELFAGAGSFEAATAKLQQFILDHFPGSNIQQVGANVDQQGRFAMGGCEFVNSDGQLVHLMLKPTASYSPDEAMFGDAPINRIVMDGRGQVVADQQFERHAALRVYQPDEPIAAAWLKYHPTLTKLQEKIPDLRYVPPGQSVEVAEGGFVDRCGARESIGKVR